MNPIGAPLVSLVEVPFDLLAPIDGLFQPAALTGF